MTEKNRQTDEKQNSNNKKTPVVSSPPAKETARHQSDNPASASPASSSKPDSKSAPKADRKKDTASKAGSKKSTAAATDSGPNKNTHKPATKPAPARSSGGLIAWLAFAGCLGLGGGGWYGWQLLQQQLNATSSEQQALRTALNTQIKQLNAQQQSQSEALNKQQEVLLLNINEVHSRLGNTTRDWMLSEAHYLLQMGNQQARLAGNIDTATVALELADKRLRDVSEPALLPVRQQITRELNALKALKQVDVNAIVLGLGEFALQSQSLPLAAGTQPQPGEMPLVPEINAPAEQDTSWRSIISAIWNALKSLVTVRYHEQGAQPLLTPAHAKIIRDSLELKLNQARLAALQRNDAIFQDSLAQSRDWLTRYFVTDDGRVNNLQNSIEQWRKLKLELDVPDISKSRRMLVDTAARLKMNIQNQPKKTQKQTGKPVKPKAAPKPEQKSAPANKGDKKPTEPAAPAAGKSGSNSGQAA